MKIPLLDRSLLGRPRRKSTPLVTPHNKGVYRRLLLNAVLNTLKPSIEPAHIERVQIPERLRAKIHVANFGGGVHCMAPGPINQLLIGMARGNHTGVVELGTYAVAIEPSG